MNGSTASAGSSSSTSAVHAPLAVYRAAYKRADDFCKEVQSFVEEAGIPALNELRYAGYHLLVATDDDGQVSGGHLQKALNHANRACYEAGEAGILCALDHITAFKEDYKDVVIHPVVPNWVDILTACDLAMDRVTAEREQGEDRESDFNDFVVMFKQLRDFCRALDRARDELNKLVAEQVASVRKDQRDGRRFIITSIIGLPVAIGTVVLVVMGFQHH